jgi:hypothetical protein
MLLNGSCYEGGASVVNGHLLRMANPIKPVSVGRSSISSPEEQAAKFGLYEDRRLCSLPVVTMTSYLASSASQRSA